MSRNLFLTFMSAALAVGVFTASQYGIGVAHAADQGKIKVVTLPLAKTSPVSGKQMYGSYCAQCHGVNGKGDGSVGVSLKTQPTDLTVLSRNNGGKFPSAHIASVLQFGATDAAHRTASMPAWGPILAKMDRADSAQRLLRISNLSRYLESMQAR